jgi:ParB family chromosome partitioning protein
MIKTIPMNKLVRSARNVRRASDPQADFQLKADIEARGLLQNLVVTSVAKPKGSFAVEAGGRRLRALQSLVEDGKLSKSHEVCCLVIEGGPAVAQEASLAENFQRLAMNPADECVAFHQLIEQGSDIDGIARRFGLTTRFVEGRLRLANLAPIVFDALGSGEISLEVAKAYATTPDRQRQAYVFEQMGRSYNAAHPDSIRRMMTQATASATDRRARFVGEEAYLVAGGRIERDLFADDAATRWLDIAILERLACEKMEALAGQATAEAGLGWVRPSLDSWIGHAQTEGLHRVHLETQPLSDTEIAQIDSLEAEIEELAESLEHDEMDEPSRDLVEAKIRKIGEQIDAIVNKPPVIDDELKPQVGTFLILDEQGVPKLHPALYSEAPLNGEATSSGDGSTAVEPAAGGKREAGLSQRLIDELAMQRRDILAAHVASDPALALDLAIFLMVDREAGYSAERRGTSLSALAPQDPVFGFKTPEAPATLARAEAEEGLDRSWIEEKSRAARFDAFRALSEEARAAWLGYAVGRTLEASLNLPGDRSCSFHDHLGQLLGIDVARWWRPTGANYFDRVPKGVTLAALAEVGGPALAARYAKVKKTELAQSCERIFSGDFIAEIEVKEAALAWVPNVMRFAAAEPQSRPAESEVHETEAPLGESADAGATSPVELAEEAA